MSQDDPRAFRPHLTGCDLFRAQDPYALSGRLYGPRRRVEVRNDEGPVRASCVNLGGFSGARFPSGHLTARCPCCIAPKSRRQRSSWVNRVVSSIRPVRRLNPNYRTCLTTGRDSGAPDPRLSTEGGRWAQNRITHGSRKTAAPNVFPFRCAADGRPTSHDQGRRLRPGGRIELRKFFMIVDAAVGIRDLDISGAVAQQFHCLFYGCGSRVPF